MKMKRSILALLSFIVAVFILLQNSYCYGQNIEFKEGYKNAKWGMSKEQVKKSFPDMTFKEEGELCLFLSEIAEEDVIIFFSFLNDKLYKVIVSFDIKTMNKKNYIQKYNKFQGLLIKKYGEPKRNVRRGSSNEYIDDATAISMGEGTYFTTWALPETNISLILGGDNFDLKLVIYYSCRKLEQEKEKEKKSKTLDDL
jgi:hypothetical protein